MRVAAQASIKPIHGICAASALDRFRVELVRFHDLRLNLRNRQSTAVVEQPLKQGGLVADRPVKSNAARLI